MSPRSAATELGLSVLETHTGATVDASAALEGKIVG